MRLVWFGRRVARLRVELGNFVKSGPPAFLIAHLEAFLSCDMGSCLHTTYMTRVVKCLAVVWLSLLVALGWPHLHVPVPKVLSGLTSVGRYHVGSQLKTTL